MSLASCASSSFSAMRAAEKIRIFHDFEETVSLIGRKGSFQIDCLGLQQVVGVEIALQLIAELARMKLCIAVWHCHEGWLSDTGQAIVLPPSEA